MKKQYIIILLLAFFTSGVGAQVLRYQDYIDSVKSRNAEMVAQRLSVPISEAEVLAARTSDDPTLSFEYGNNSDWSIQMGQSASAEISKSLAPGKRMARVAVAKSSLALAKAESDDFWRNLKADATIDFYDALLAKTLFNIGAQAYENIESLAKSDSVRFVKGEISELDMLQSRLEQHRAQQELNNRRTDFLNSLVVLDVRCGNAQMNSRDVEGELSVPGKMFDLSVLLNQAMKNRADVLAADCAVRLAADEEKLALRECRSDAELALGASYNTRVLNEEAPAPDFVGYTVGLSIPLPMTSVNRGVRKAGQLRVQQANAENAAVRANVRGEVVKAYNNYQSALGRAQAYANNMMAGARQVLEGKLYAYQRGDTSLLEVLVAQQTFNEIQEEYATSLHDCMVALAELERSVGNF